MSVGMESPDIEDRPSQLRVYLIVLAASTLHFSTGAVSSWSSPILPKLNLTDYEQGLVASLSSFGAAPGPFITTFCLDTVGRKGTMYVVWVFYMASWVLLLLSQNVNVIYIARMIGGLGIGGAMSGLPVYAAEVATAGNRGRVGAASSMMMGVGALIIYLVGPYVSYYTISIYGVAMVALSAVMFFFVPESPFHLINKGKTKEAEEALQRLRGYSTRRMLEEELEEIKKAVFQDEEKVLSWFKVMKQPAALKAMGLGLYLTSMIYFSGTTVQGAYAETIYSSINLSYRASYIGVAIVFGVIFFSFLPILFINKCVGMKTGIVISAYGTGLTSILLGFYFYFNQAGYDLYDYSYLAIVLSVANAFAYSIGMGALVMTVAAELLPMSIKGVGMGIAGCFSSLINFGVMNLFPIIASHYGYHTDFFGLGVIMLILSTLTIFILPDTTGKTLQEIEELLQ